MADIIKPKWYRCKSRVAEFGHAKTPILGSCPFNCEVNLAFFPRGCLLYAVWQEWEEVKERSEGE